MNAAAGGPRRVYIFDTTLRDGEQSPGVSLSHNEKLELAAQLARLGVDVIEAGFPISSPGEFAAVRAIAEASRDWDESPVICGLARANRADIDAARRAVQPALRPRIHIYTSVSAAPADIRSSRSRREVLQRVQDAVRLARECCGDVQFTAAGAPDGDVSLLEEIYCAAYEAGASTLGIPDAGGCALPEEFGRLVGAIVAGLPRGCRAVISVHTHDDLGLATANALAAVAAGARQVECTVNGIGGRAGNASLEEFVIAVHARRSVLGVRTGIRNGEIYRTSRMVSALTGLIVPPNKAVVGRNAFSDAPGVLQESLQKTQAASGDLSPATIGRPESPLVLDRSSGSGDFRARLDQLGIRLTEQQLQLAVRQFRELADRKTLISDEDLEAVAGGALVYVPESFGLDYFQISTGNRSVPTATVRLRFGDGSLREVEATGDGPVHAMYHAVDRLSGLPVVLDDYALNAATSGKDALGQVTVKLDYKGHVYSGRGVSTDILEASLRAYIHALNKIVADGGRTTSAEGPADRPG